MRVPMQVGDFLINRGGYNRDYKNIKVVVRINQQSITVKPWVYGTDTKRIPVSEIKYYERLTNESIHKYMATLFCFELRMIRDTSEVFRDIPIHDTDMLMIDPFKMREHIHTMMDNFRIIDRLLHEIPAH